MFFFITRKQFEFHINNCVNRIIEQYGFDEIESNIYNISSELSSLKKDISKAVNTLSNQDKQFNGELVRVSNELNNYKEEIRGLAENRASVDEDILTGIIQSELSKCLLNIKSDLSTEISRKLPDNIFDEKDIRVIVRNELRNSQYSQGFDENDIRKIVNEELKRVNNEPFGKQEINKEQLLAEMNAYVSQKVSAYQSRIQTEIESKNRDIDNLRNSLQQESLKNSEYARKIISQEKEISALNDTIRVMKSDIDKLTDVISALTKAESSEISSPSEISVPPSISGITYVVFGSEMENNNKHLENIINQTKMLREKVTEVFDDSQDLEIYLKLIDKCILKVEQLLLKNKDGDLEPDKLANDCAKIYKQTIVKAMSQEKLKDLLNEYMRACNFRKLEWYIGKKISDDDFEYLEEPILYEEVEDKELDCTIRAIKQDTYIIDYMDEDEKYEVIIPGIYCLGKFRK